MAFTKDDLASLKARLQSLSSGEEFIAFQRKLTPGEDRFLGVRVPELRKVAKELLKGDWRGFLEADDHSSHELNMLHAIIVARAKCEDFERMRLIQAYVPFITNWGTCDTLGMDIELKPAQLAPWWAFLGPFLRSDQEFELRLGAVLLQSCYLNDGYIDRTLPALCAMRHPGYYVKMAVAWALATAAIGYPDRVIALLAGGQVADKFTHNKAIQKACESYRVTDADKQRLKALRRK